MSCWHVLSLRSWLYADMSNVYSDVHLLLGCLLESDVYSLWAACSILKVLLGPEEHPQNAGVALVSRLLVVYLLSHYIVVVCLMNLVNWYAFDGRLFSQ